MYRRTHRPDSRGQTLVELSLVLPLFLMVLVGIVVFGIGVFYQQQMSNAAREAARYAAIHSATALCPTEGALQPEVGRVPDTYPWTGCDNKAAGWPGMTAHARSTTFGLQRTNVRIAACWSGYQRTSDAKPDYPPPGVYTTIGSVTDSVFVQCTIDGQDPTQAASAIGCANALPTADKASALSESKANIVANTVTTYACYVWTPPMAGFLLIPPQVTLRAVATEAIQRQQ